MTACRECLLEAAEVLGQMPGGTRYGEHLRQMARTAPAWAIDDDDHGFQVGDEVEVLLVGGGHSTWQRVRILSFWRGGFDWAADEIAGRVTWAEEGTYWRRVAGEGEFFDTELARYDNRIRQIGERLADFASGRVAAAVDPFGATLPHNPDGPTAPCRSCQNPIRAHVGGLCRRCWQRAGRPEGPVEVVTEEEASP
jgi:hypothetical protein